MANIYDFVTEEEAGFRKPIYLERDWWWSMKEHIRRSFLYKNSQFTDKNSDRDRRPFRNIVLPILNVQYRTEDIDVKDIEIYVDNPENYFKSFLIKKFHEKWALKNEMDTFIDEMIQSYVDYGGVLVKNVDSTRPEVVDLRTIAFCDQTDMLSGPLAIKHFFSPDDLRDMEKNGWGKTSSGATISIEDIIIKSEKYKHQDKDGTKSETPGKYTQVYEVHGTFPESYLGGKGDKYTSQIHIIAFYQNDEGNAVGVTLFHSEEPEPILKFLSRDPVQGRALGRGGVEELFDAQVWTNSAEIHIFEMLEIAALTLYKTDDSRFKTRNNVLNMDQGQILDLAPGKDITQLDTAPQNLAGLNDSTDRWEQHANTLGAASEALQGETPNSGTPFKLFEAQIIENKSLHRWRQGKLAVFLDEIYRDWLLPQFAKEITKGQKFLASLSADELQQVSDRITAKKVSEFVKEEILSGRLPVPEEVAQKGADIQESFIKGGEKRFLEILKGELKGDKLEVFTNIAGKQKNLALLTDKLVNLIRQFIATPEIRQDPGMIKLLNTVLESSGMSPINFAPVAALAQGGQQGGGSTEGLKALGEGAKEAQPV